MLGGVRVPHTHGVVAHSDGDVVLHALCDALLGAAGLGDIGQHFRDTDPQVARRRQRRLRRARYWRMLRERGLAVVNADLTIIAQAPQVAPLPRGDPQPGRAATGTSSRRASTSRRPPPRASGSSAARRASPRRPWCCCADTAECRLSCSARAAALAPPRAHGAAAGCRHSARRSPRTSWSRRTWASRPPGPASTCC